MPHLTEERCGELLLCREVALERDVGHLGARLQSDLSFLKDKTQSALRFRLQETLLM